MRARSRRTVPLVALLLLAAACTGSDDGARGPTTSSSSSTTSTVPVDYSKVVLGPVPGSTTTTVVLGPGAATLEGVVVGPDGPASGATVRLERLVGDSAAVADVPVAEDGTWSAPGILGGRYRVRAWRAPTLAMVEPLVLFLEGAEARRLELRLQDFGGTVALAATDPAPPPVDQVASLAVRVATRVVDDEGVVRSRPEAGVSVRLSGSGRWRVRSDPVTVTDGQGQATWQLECEAEGIQPLSVVLAGGDVLPLDLDACVSPRPEPTSSSSSTSTSSTSSTSSSTTTTSPTTSTTTDQDDDR